MLTIGHTCLYLLNSKTRWQVACYEIYMEAIHDLLATEEDAGKEYRVREDLTGPRGIYVENLRVREVHDLEGAMACLAQAATHRTTAATAANDSSSRSHSLVTVDVVQSNLLEGGLRTLGRLNLVDLAGSEKVAKTKAAGDRLKEAQKINLSLTLLGNVIYKLTDGRSVHIPYRDSKLTRILQDSLGGNSKTCLLCMCSAAAADHAETANTLLFATRAKRIKNRPQAHRELSAPELTVAFHKAQEEVRALRDRVAELEARPPGPGAAAGGAAAAGDDAAADLRAEVQSLLKELQEVRAELYDRAEQAQAAGQQAAFYRAKHEGAEAVAKDWKDKYLREKKACDSWLRKFTDLQKARAKAGDRPKKGGGAKPRARPGGAHRPPAKATAPPDLIVSGSGARGGSGPLSGAPRGGPPPPAGGAEAASPGAAAAADDGAAPDAGAEEDAEALRGELADALLQRSALQEELEQQQQQREEQARTIAELTERVRQQSSGLADLQALEERRAAALDELTREHENHRKAWLNKQKENEALVAEIEAMRADIKVADLPDRLKASLLGSGAQEMSVGEWREPTLLDQLAKTLGKEASQKEALEVVALDLMVKTEDLLDVENDVQLLSHVTGALTRGQREAAQGALQKAMDAGAYLMHQKKILSLRTFATPELESQRVNCIAELDDLLKKAAFLCKNVKAVVSR